MHRSPWACRWRGSAEGAGLVFISARTLYQFMGIVFGQVDFCRGDFLECHGCAPFTVCGPLEKKKKTFIPQGHSYGFPLGQKSATSAVPPAWRLLAHSATCQHTSFPGNGKPVGAYWGEIVQPALCGPFGRAPSAAIPPPRPFLLEKRRPCTRPRHWFCVLNLLSVQHAGPACQALKKTL